MQNRIKGVREALQLSQREFGEKLGVSRDVISNLEYDRVQPKDIFLLHICETYGVNEAWLKNGEGDMFKENAVCDKKLQEVLKIFKSLRPEFQDYALEQIKKLAELQDEV